MKLKSEAFGLLFAVTLTAGAGNMALQSVLPAIGREFGLADTLVAFAFALSALLWTVASPYWARLSDRWGRKRVMMIGLIGFIVSMLGFGVAATLGLVHWLSAPVAFVLMAIARAVYGLLGSAAPIAAQAYVADRTSRRARTRAMSMLASAQGLGTVIGPARRRVLAKHRPVAAASSRTLAMKGAGSVISYRATPITGGARKLRPASDIINPATAPCSCGPTDRDEPAVKPGRAKPTPIETTAYPTTTP